MNIEPIITSIIDTSLHLHRRMGPGLLESIYKTVLCGGLQARGHLVERELTVPFEFDGIRFEEGLRVDLLVDRIIVIEVKAVEKLALVHFRQTLTYLKLLNLPVGLLINFGGATLKEGLRRIVNNYHPYNSSEP